MEVDPPPPDDGDPAETAGVSSPRRDDDAAAAAPPPSGGLHDAADASSPSDPSSATAAAAANTTSADAAAKEAVAASSAAPPNNNGDAESSSQPQTQEPSRRLPMMSSSSSDQHLRQSASDAALRAVRAVLGDKGSAGTDNRQAAADWPRETTGATAGGSSPANASGTASTCAASSSALRPAAPSPASATADTAATSSTTSRIAESVLNLTLLHPDRYGWTAAGGIADLATPHQRARSAATQAAYTAHTVPTLRSAQTALADAKAERRRARQRTRDRERREERRRTKELAQRRLHLQRTLMEREGMSPEEAASKVNEPEVQRQLMAGWEEQRRREREGLELQQLQRRQQQEQEQYPAIQMAQDRWLASQQASQQQQQRAHAPSATGATVGAVGAVPAGAPLHANAQPVSMGGGVNSSSLERIRALAASDRARAMDIDASGTASRDFDSSAVAAAAPPPTSAVASAQHSDAAASLVSLAAGPPPPPKEAVPAATTADIGAANASGSVPDSGDKDKEMTNPNKPDSEAASSGKTPAPSLQGQSAEATSSAKPKSKKKKVPPKDQVITPLALGEDGLVDIYAYHRGRAGLEPRSPRSGELLCDVAPSDTGQQFAQNKEAEEGGDKKLIVTINISFPLCDMDDVLEEEEEEEEENATAVAGNDTAQSKSAEESGGVSKDLPLQKQNSRDANYAGTSRHLLSRENSAASHQSRKNSSRGVPAANDKDACPAIPRFHDQIEWDLSSPDTPTAMAYATSVASEFGLSFGQTLDLASSIQDQIDAFVRKSGIIRPLPVAAKDPLGADRPASSSVVLMPTLHGGAHNGGGTVQVISQQQQEQGGVARANLSRTSSRVSASSGRSRQRDAVEHSIVPEHMLKTFETEENKYSVAIEFRREVVKRAKEEYRQQLIAEHEGDVGDGGMVGNLEFVKDEVCHICHKRKSAGVKFSCKNHVFCENHCCTRMGFSAKAIRDGNPMALDYCPVCCRTCLCSKCTKKLDDVSSHFQRLCDNQGCSDDPAACQAKNILELCVGQSSLHRAQSELKKSSSSTKRRAPIDADDASQSSRGSRSVRDTATVSTKKQEPPKPKKIGKPKPSEFPVEACGGFDLDPSLENDHRTVFLPDGASYVRNEAPMPPPNVEELELVGAGDSSGIVEDGSVDYCQHCQLGGDLICCDRCPRSFHAKCLPDGLDEDDIPDADWMCHLCVRDSSAQPNNDISGARTIGLITAAYTDIDHCEGFTEKLLTMSKIHELLAFLVEFDFGYMFKDPVNAKDVPDYTRIIKKPMDLGTIRGNLINLKYTKAAKRDLSTENIPESQMTARILDEIILSALKDLELIYHNCFTYNVRGTAVYRMAEVQRRKAKMIIEKSIVPCLDEESAGRLEEYSRQLQMSRDENTAKGPKRVAPSVHHKINVPFTHSKNGRIIAVFDPTKNMVIKQYSSVRGAVKAALYIAGLGYEPELNVTDNSVKNLIRKSSRDPSQQLFQYRWFYLDDLRSGRVTIIPLPISEEDRVAMDEARKAGKDSSPAKSKSPTKEDASKTSKSKDGSSPKKKAHKKAKVPAKREDEEKAEYCIERRANQRVVYYKSIEAALDALNQEAILARAALVQPVKFQASLESVSPGDEVVTMGSKWRLLETAPRLTSNGRRPNLPIHPDDKGKDKSDTDTITCYPGLAAIFSLGDDMFFEPSMETVLPHCIIVKVCRLSNKILGGFESIQSAFEDWKQCRDGVLCGFPPNDPITIEAFHTLYVKGEKNIEGIEWKEVEPLETRFKRPRANSTGGDGDDKKKSSKRPRIEEKDGGDETAAGNTRSGDEDALPSSGDMDVETLV